MSASMAIRGCPFCGASAAKADIAICDDPWPQETVFAYVFCRACRARGPLVRDAEAAVAASRAWAAWNGVQASPGEFSLEGGEP